MARGYIVVGIDGSPSSRSALDWALEEAGLRNCSVQVVTVLQVDPDEGHTDDTARAARHVHAAEQQGALISAALAATGCRKPLTFKLTDGTPYEVLVDMSADADLIVLGSHGVSGLRHSVLGSTSDAVARMSSCPVVVIPTRTMPPTEHHDLPMTMLLDDRAPRPTATIP